MGVDASQERPLRALVAYDGSPSAVNAIEAGAQLLPRASATMVYLWRPPFASPELRHRLSRQARGLDELVALLEQEGHAEADRLVSSGVTLARAAGWSAEAIVRRSYGGDGYQLARMAEEQGADLIAMGSRGLEGAKALLGSTSDLVVHVSPVPVLVVPCPLTTSERTAAATGPVLVATDGSEGAGRAASTSAMLFPDREQMRVTVEAAGDPVPDGSGNGQLVRLPVTGRPGRARSVAGTLAEYAAERDAGVIVVGSRGRSPSREILLGSVAKAVLHHAHRPVLVVPAPHS